VLAVAVAHLRQAQLVEQRLAPRVVLVRHRLFLDRPPLTLAVAVGAASTTQVAQLAGLVVLAVVVLAQTASFQHRPLAQKTVRQVTQTQVVAVVAVLVVAAMERQAAQA
jgi:hypothetical protein